MDKNRRAKRSETWQKPGGQNVADAKTSNEINEKDLAETRQKPGRNQAKKVKNQAARTGFKAALDAVWPQCAKHLEPALKFADGSHTLDHVRAEIERRTAQLWPVGEHGAIVSEIVETPTGKRVCRLWLAGGDMAALIAAEAVIAEWAQEQACQAMEVVGRPGWQRVLPDYRRSAVVLRKQLGGQDGG